MTLTTQFFLQAILDINKQFLQCVAATYTVAKWICGNQIFLIFFSGLPVRYL